MTTCQFCGSRRVIGVGDTASCASCGRFVTDRRDATEQAFDRQRSQLTPAERQQEVALRQALRLPVGAYWSE